MKYITMAIFLLAINSTHAFWPTNPKERTTLGEIYTYICEEFIEGTYAQNQKTLLWECTK